MFERFFIALFIIALLYVVIIIHEFGHLLVGKWLGFPVRTFSIGMGPLIKVLAVHDGISYEWRWIPIGGYVAMADDDEVPPDAHTPLHELLLYGAGVWMNLMSVGLVQLYVVGYPWLMYHMTGAQMVGWHEGLLVELMQAFCDVSVAVMAFNMLPIPGLDGGRMLVAGIEVWRKRRFNASNKLLVHTVGLLLVLIWVAWDWIKFIGWMVAPLLGTE